MGRPEARGGVAAKAGVLTILLAVSGCDGGGSPPSVSTTTAQATVHGTVKYKGQPVTGGTIRFDPTNIKRRDAQIATGPIGKDGTYKVTTLQGGNVVHFELPAEILKKEPHLAAFTKEFDVPSGDATFDVDITK